MLQRIQGWNLSSAHTSGGLSYTDNNRSTMRNRNRISLPKHVYLQQQCVECKGPLGTIKDKLRCLIIEPGIKDT